MDIVESIASIVWIILKNPIEIIGAIFLYMGCSAAVKSYFKWVQNTFKKYDSNIEFALELLGILFIIFIYFKLLYKLFGLSLPSSMD